MKPTHIFRTIGPCWTGHFTDCDCPEYDQLEINLEEKEKVPPLHKGCVCWIEEIKED